MDLLRLSNEEFKVAIELEEKAKCACDICKSKVPYENIHNDGRDGKMKCSHCYY